MNDEEVMPKWVFKAHSLLLLAVLLISSGERGNAAKEKFVRSKPHVNIGTIGSYSNNDNPIKTDNKVTLTAVITKILSEAGYPTFRPLPQVLHGSENGAQGVRLSSCEVEYQTDTTMDYFFRHYDCPERDTFVLDWIGGKTLMDDGAVLVVSAVDGATPQTREHILLARQVGVPAMIVVIDDINQVQDTGVQQLRTQIVSLLSQAGFPEDQSTSTPFILCDVEAAYDGENHHVEKIVELIGEIESRIPPPTASAFRDFLMPIERVSSSLATATRGTPLTEVIGTVERGNLTLGDAVNIVGYSSSAIRTYVESFEILNNNKKDIVLPGDLVRLLLPATVDSNTPIQVGQVVAKPDSVNSHKKFSAEIYVLDKTNGSTGRDTPFFTHYRPQFYFRTADVTGEISKLPNGIQMVMPGDHSEMEVELSSHLAIEKQQRFSIKDPERQVLVGVGIVTSVNGN